MMNLKTSKIVAIELAVSNYYNLDLELCGIRALSKFNKTVSLSLDTSDTEHSFENIFGYNCNFFYNVEKIKDDKVICSEYGIASIEKIDDKVFLNRNRPIYLNANNKITQCHNGPHHFQCEDSEYLAAYSVVPSSYIELLANPNCVIGSSAPFCPSPIPIDSNSFLGRIDDNVQSIPFNQLFSHPELISAILEVITTYSKQLSLKTSKLDAKRLCTDSIQLNSNDKILDKKGTLGFDGKDLKFYDGEVWRILEWRSCQE